MKIDNIKKINTSSTSYSNCRNHDKNRKFSSRNSKSKKRKRRRFSSSKSTRRTNTKRSYRNRKKATEAVKKAVAAKKTAEKAAAVKEAADKAVADTKAAEEKTEAAAKAAADAIPLTEAQKLKIKGETAIKDEIKKIVTSDIDNILLKRIKKVFIFKVQLVESFMKIYIN